MNTVKKIVAIIIIVALIYFFINAYSKVEQFREDFKLFNDISNNIQEFFNNSASDQDAEDAEDDVMESIQQRESSGTYMYTYKDNVDLSEYILKTEIPRGPDMSKYILKSKVKACDRCDDEDQDETSANNDSNNQQKSEKSKNIVEKVSKDIEDTVVKTADKSIKQAVKDTKTVAKPITKIASKLNNIIKPVKPLKADQQAKKKMSKDKDLVNKSNVTSLGKDTKNGNPVVFQFDKILPNDLTYKKNKCIRSNVVGTDNSNVVKKEPKKKSFMEKLFSFFT